MVKYRTNYEFIDKMSTRTIFYIHMKYACQHNTPKFYRVDMNYCFSEYMYGMTLYSFIFAKSIFFF